MKCKYKAIVFDFDGVIVESSDIKTMAYAQLYKEYGPDVVEKVIRYNIVQGGLSRHEHFRYFHNNILKKDLSNDEEIDLAEKFSQLVKKTVIDAPYVSGIIEFISTHKDIMDFYVASGTPEEELRYIINARDITHYFKCIYGSPLCKAEIINNILTYSNLEKKDVIMIGDNMTDYDGATIAGISFIGRISEVQEDILPRDIFPTSVTIIRDFNDKMTLHSALFQQ